MCAFDKESTPESARRRRAALIACFVPVMTSFWLFLLPHGETHRVGPLATGLGVGVAFGVGILALRRRLG